MKPTDEQIRAEAERYSDAKGELALARGKMENAFIAGYNKALSQDSTIEKVKELRDEICTLIHNWSGYRCLDSQINEIFERYINKQ